MIAMQARIIRAVIAILILGLALDQPSRADDASTTFGKLSRSLAVVAAPEPKTSFAFGSAFCVASDHTTSYWLTNEHVVGTDDLVALVVPRLGQKPTVVKAMVLRTNKTFDVALLSAPLGDVPAVKLSSRTLSVGEEVGIAGFPREQLMLWAAGAPLSPSFHHGSISSVLFDGALYEYDAQTDHGNSGSPLFDLATGEVYAYVQGGDTGETGAVQNNLAFAVGDISQFAQNAHVTLSFDSTNTLSDYCQRNPDDTICSPVSKPQVVSSSVSQYDQPQVPSDCSDALSSFQDGKQQSQAKNYPAAAYDFESARDSYIVCSASVPSTEYSAMLLLAATASGLAAVARILSDDRDDAKSDWNLSQNLLDQTGDPFSGDLQQTYQRTRQLNDLLASTYGWSQ